MFNFDEKVIRRGTACVKWDEQAEGVIPMWVADMDFKAAPAIVDAIVERAHHGVYGYNIVPESYYESVINWFRRRHAWNIEREWILYTTGGVPAISACIKGLTEPGDKVLVNTPAYNCFFSSIRNNGCTTLNSQLKTVVEDGVPHFELDYEDLEKKAADPRATVMLFCSPHNPAGRIWSREELCKIVDICRRNGVKMICDEIHCEFVMEGAHFTPIAPLLQEAGEDFVIINSASKAFNIAGLGVCNIISNNAEWRARIDRAININEVCDLNAFGIIALQTAYNECGGWIDELNAYLKGNYEYLTEFFRKELPEFPIYRMDGTYLAWMDRRAIRGLGSSQVKDELLEVEKVFINPGDMYGDDSGMRINFACPRSQLEEGLVRIKKGLRRLLDARN